MDISSKTANEIMFATGNANKLREVWYTPPLPLPKPSAMPHAMLTCLHAWLSAALLLLIAPMAAHLSIACCSSHEHVLLMCLSILDWNHAALELSQQHAMQHDRHC